MTYIAYDRAFVYAQRKINMPKELPDKTPRTSAALCHEAVAFAFDQNQEQLQLGEDDLTTIFVINKQYRGPIVLV